MSGIAHGADQSDHIQTKLTVRQGPFSLLFWPIGPMIPLARWIATAAHAQNEPTTPLQHSNGSLGAVRHCYQIPTAAAAGTQACQHLLRRRRSATVFSCHRMVP
jgi:hypothetical protein